MPEHHDQARAEGLGGELDAADLRGRDDVARDADHEQVAESLVEHDLGRHARIRAAEDDGEWLLARAAARDAARRRCRLARSSVDEAPIAFAQRCERGQCGVMGTVSSDVAYTDLAARRQLRRRTPRVGCAPSGSSGQ